MLKELGQKTKELITEFSATHMLALVETQCQSIKCQIEELETLMTHYNTSIGSQLLQQFSQIKYDFNEFLKENSEKSSERD